MFQKLSNTPSNPLIKKQQKAISLFLYVSKRAKHSYLFILFFKFFSFIFISWRLITLQYCSGFCHTLTWISHGFTCIPHPTSLSTQSLCVFPVHQAWALVSCIQPGQVICFTLVNIHVSMLFSLTALFIIARTWKQPRCPSADEWIRKLWYVCTMEYYSAIKKNSFESVLMRWMKLEPIIQSEVSQEDKDQYSILTLFKNMLEFEKIM